MTKTEFIRQYLDIASTKGAFRLDESRALANCIDQIEAELKESAKTGEITNPEK